MRAALRGAWAAVALIGRSLREFSRDNGLLLAGSLSYFIVLALVPVVVLLAILAGEVLGRDASVIRFIAERLTGLLPEATSSMKKEFKALIQWREISTLSLALYVLISYQLYAALNQAFEHIFKTRTTRRLLDIFVLPLLVMLVLLALVTASYVFASVLVSIVKGSRGGPVPQELIRPTHIFIVRFVLPFAMMFGLMAALYKILPRRLVMWRHAFMGAAFAAIMLEAAKHMFSWYVRTVADMGTMYGSLSAFVTFLLWVYYSSAILIIGAEMVKLLGEEQAA